MERRDRLSSRLLAVWFRVDLVRRPTAVLLHPEHSPKPGRRFISGGQWQFLRIGSSLSEAHRIEMTFARAGGPQTIAHSRQFRPAEGMGTIDSDRTPRTRRSRRLGGDSGFVGSAVRDFRVS